MDGVRQNGYGPSAQRIQSCHIRMLVPHGRAEKEYEDSYDQRLLEARDKHRKRWFWISAILAVITLILAWLSQHTGRTGWKIATGVTLGLVCLAAIEARHLPTSVPKTLEQESSKKQDRRWELLDDLVLFL